MTSCVFSANNTLCKLIDTSPKNYKINRNTNTNFANISYKMRLSQLLKLDGSSQQISLIGRNSGKCQYGNFYLGQPLNVNYLGRTEGMAGGSGRPPTNKY